MKINGFRVELPENIKPFPAQIAVMNKIITALKRKEHALIESPTGTGKTLSILSSVLSWYVETRENNLKEIDKELKEKKENSPTSILETVQKLQIYSINSNASNETNNLNYYSDLENSLRIEDKIPIPMKYEMENAYLTPETPETVKEFKHQIFYLTRTHSQIKQVIKEFKRTPYSSKVKMTVLSSREHTCIHPKAKKVDKNEFCLNLLKNEECEYKKKSKKIYERLSNEYNHGFDIEELVKIGKECKECPYFTARELYTNAEIIFCPYNYVIDPIYRRETVNIENSIIIFDEAHNICSNCRECLSCEYLCNEMLKMKDRFLLSINKYSSDDYPMYDYHLLYNFINNLCKWMKNEIYKKDNVILSGYEILEMFENWCELNGSNYYIIMNALNKIEPPKDITNNKSKIPSKEELSYNMIGNEALCFIEKIATIFKYLYKIEYVECFRLVVDNKYSIVNKRIELSFQILCMDPCVLFNDLSSKCYSIILASGTLAPLSTFKSELDCNFGITLESQHVINTSKQLRVLSISSYKNMPLLGTKENIHSFGYIDAIGNTILKLINHIPEGVLCFVPSYKSLDEMKVRWENTKLYNEIDKIKTIFFESKNGGKSFNKMINEYRDSLCDIYGNNKNRSGSILFAVYRGKVSEGIDFSDNYCRSVIAIGIPYQNYGSYDVSLKLKYQDDMMRKKRNSLGSRDWYSQDAFRTINQAVGRCIRHKYDYGSIILIDKRYNEIQYEKMLSKWYSKYLLNYGEVDGVLNELDKFYFEVIKEIEEMKKVEKEKIENEMLKDKSSLSLSLSLSSSSLTPSTDTPLKRKRESSVIESPICNSLSTSPMKEEIISNLYPFKCVNCHKSIEIRSEDSKIEEIEENNSCNNHYIIQLFTTFLKKRKKQKLFVIKYPSELFPVELFSSLEVNKCPNISDPYIPFYSDEEDESDSCYSVYDVKDECIFSPIFCKNCKNEKPIGVYNHSLKEVIIYLNSIELINAEEFNEYYMDLGMKYQINKIDSSFKDTLSFIYNQSNEEIYSALANIMKDIKTIKNMEIRFYSLYMKDLLNYRSEIEVFENNEVETTTESQNQKKKRKMS